MITGLFIFPQSMTQRRRGLSRRRTSGTPTLPSGSCATWSLWANTGSSCAPAPARAAEPSSAWRAQPWKQVSPRSLRPQLHNVECSVIHTSPQTVFHAKWIIIKSLRVISANALKSLHTGAMNYWTRIQRGAGFWWLQKQRRGRSWQHK